MGTTVHDFDWPDRLAVGAVGRPGQRTFYLQVRDGSQGLTVSLEKEQSAALADRMDELLDELMAADGNPASIPAQAPDGLDDSDPLDTPIVDQFRVGLITLGWDPSTAQVVIEALPLMDDDLEGVTSPDEAEPAEMLRIRIPVGAARAFSKRTRRIVLAGRPYCPLCLNPMDPEGHECPGSEAP